jgi:protein-S-isoprenylcysteine O-methyltransferase Ste14
MLHGKNLYIEGTSKPSIALIAILGASFGFLWTTFGVNYLEPSKPLIQTFSLIGLFITLLGQFLCIWGIITLRKSFSLLPEARELVTTGPYKLFHHPHLCRL